MVGMTSTSSETSPKIQRPAEFRTSVLRSKDNCAAADRNLASGNGIDAAGIQFMLGGLDSRVQRFGGVGIQHRDGLLADNGAGIDTGIHEVDGATGDLYPIIERLFPGFQSGKRW